MALKDIPQAFNVDSEEDIRIAVVKYFQELGFELNEIRAETRFTIQLGHNELLIGGKKFHSEIRLQDEVISCLRGMEERWQLLKQKLRATR